MLILSLALRFFFLTRSWLLLSIHALTFNRIMYAGTTAPQKKLSIVIIIQNKYRKDVLA